MRPGGGIVKLSEFDQKLGNTRIHNSLIVQHSGYWPELENSPIRLKLTIPNGYTFNDFNEQGLESALGRAVGMWYAYPDHFRELMANGMRYDFSWKNPGQYYLNIYDYIRDK